MSGHHITKCALAVAMFGYGATGLAAGPVTLQEITVKGEGMNDAERAFSVYTISQDEIKAKSSGSPISLIEKAPGVNITAYQQGGVADVFQIRGFTGGGHGGDAALSLDGINLNEGQSHSDGYADTNLIIPLELDTITVYKGPVSPLYGNFARGGAVAFTTRKGGDYQDFDLAMGSYNSYDAQAAFGTEMDDVKINGAFQGYENEGWRDNSRYTKMNASLRVAHAINDSSEVTLSLRGHGGHWQAPGYVLWDQFKDEDRRHQQDPNVAIHQDSGDKQFSGQRIDFNHSISDNLKLLSFIYNTDHDFTRYQTSLNVNNPPATRQNEFRYQRGVQALGTSLNGKSQLSGIDSNWVVGVEYYDENTQSRQWSDITRVRQSQTGDNEFNNKTTSFYGQMDLNIHALFRPALGLRYDSFSGDRNNRLTNVKTDMNDYDHISPKLGVYSAISDNWELRTSASNGYALPNGVQAFDPNINADPVEFWQYEIGVNGKSSSQWLLDAAVFVLDSSDEIQEDPIGSGTFKNVGATRRSGIEGEVRYYPAHVDFLEVATSFGYFDSEITKNSNVALEGKVVRGQPKHVATIDVTYAPPKGLGGSLNLRSLGEWYTDVLNTVTYAGHNVLNGSVFYTFTSANGQRARLYLDIYNLTDEIYTEIASGGPHATQGNVPTTTSPMPPMNFMAGISLSL